MLLCIDDMLKRSTGRGEGGVVKLIVQYLYESNYRYTVTKVMTKEGSQIVNQPLETVLTKILAL